MRVGDRVAIKDELKPWNSYGGLSLMRDMYILKGKILTISNIRSSGTFSLEESFYFFSKEMLILVKTNEIDEEDEVSDDFDWGQIYNTMRVSHTNVSYYGNPTTSACIDELIERMRAVSDRQTHSGLSQNTVNINNTPRSFRWSVDAIPSMDDLDWEY